MNRRSILKGLALGVGGASVPLWLARPFGLDRTDDCEPDLDADEVDVDLAVPPADPPASDVPACETPSAVAGEPCTPRPQLVLVIPGERNERYYRGHAFGELLHHADDATLARLALFEVLCATPAELEKLTGRPLKGEPWMVVIDRTGPKRVVTPLADPRLGYDAEREDPLVDAKIDERIAHLSEMLEEAATVPMVKRLAAAEALALAPRLKDELDMVMEDAVAPRLELAEAATATLLARIIAIMGDDDWAYPRLRAAILPRLAELTRERLLRTRPPAGARWAHSGGCGVRIEGHKERHAIGCGMGHVPERSRRFLAWLGDYERGV
jgi:hypothetical protein